MPLETTMATLKKAVLAAIKQLLWGKTLIQAILAFWVNPRKGDATSIHGAQSVFVPKNVDEFLQDVEEAFLGGLDQDGLTALSNGLKSQYRERLEIVGENMLPSFNHLLPTGDEVGEYLALDVGGSTLRVALVHLRGRAVVGKETEIVRISSFKITPDVKKLEGMAFFDWMAQRIHEVLGEDKNHTREEIPLGMAWSFPVNQVSQGGGLLMGMGKGFLATQGLMGQDLGEIIRFACKKEGLNVKLGAIVNDGSATLLSQAYVFDSTQFGLILGTGSNMSVHLPVSALSRAKYGKRSDAWFDAATHVIVNTEMSMFGKGHLPLTRWDELLNDGHPRPDFQPLEHLAAGYYLGEICRLVLVEAIQTIGIFGGEVPSSLEKPYSLDTETISRLESDTTATLDTGIPYFISHHPCRIQSTFEDINFVRTVATMVSRRAAAIIATCVFSLWELRHEAEVEDDRLRTGNGKNKNPIYSTTAESTTTITTPNATMPIPANGITAAQGPPTPPEDKNMFLPADVSTAAPAHVSSTTKSTPDQQISAHTTVAFNGSVIEHYPGLRTNCQNYLNDLVRSSSIHQGTATVELVPTVESSILGAAVALACATEEDAKLANHVAITQLD